MEVSLPPDRSSARRARHCVLRWLHEERCDAVADVATLLVSEVVTNALAHAQTSLMLRLTVRTADVLVEVEDGSASAPRPRDFPDPEATDGRGLVLVDELAQDWGWERHEAGKTVWFELGRADRGPLQAV